MNDPVGEAVAVRELLRLSQSNVTLDPVEGYIAAAGAYKRSVHTDADPTAAGEAAAKAGFRAEQAGYAPNLVDGWFRASYDALPVRDEAFRRERVSTHLLEGRALALRQLVRSEVSSPVDLSYWASNTFYKGGNILRLQHRVGHNWDPYATMLDRHWATHEAMNGSAIKSSGLSLRGMWRAVRSARESANTPELADNRKGMVAHAAFIGKQAVSNALNGALAISKPLEKVKPIQKMRRRMAIWMLG